MSRAALLLLLVACTSRPSVAARVWRNHTGWHWAIALVVSSVDQVAAPVHP